MDIKIEVISELNTNVSSEINAYISNNYPWLPTRMDFSKISNHIHIRWGKVTDKEVEEFINTSYLSKHDYCAVLYSTQEPMKIFSLEYISKEIDLISLNKPIFIVFGTSKVNNDWEIDKDCFAYVHTGFDIWITKKQV